MIRLLSLLCLLLLAGCYPPKEQAKASAPKIAAITGTANSVSFSEITTAPVPFRFQVCRNRGESHFASNSTFRILCWSESKQIFTEPYVLLEQ